MSALQYELMQEASGLSDESIKIVLDYVRTFIVPFDRNTAKSNLKEERAAKPRVIGNRKGVKFFSDGHDIDDYDDEMEELFGADV